MNLWDIQANAVTALKAQSEFAALLPSESLAAGAILADDGSYPKTPGREEALRSLGLCLIVLELESAGLASTGNSAGAVEQIAVTVVVDYRASVAADAEHGLNHWQALHHTRQALQGKPTTNLVPQQRFLPDTPPWENYGKIGGDNRLTANFRLQHVMNYV